MTWTNLPTDAAKFVVWDPVISQPMSCQWDGYRTIWDDADTSWDNGATLWEDHQYTYWVD